VSENTVIWGTAQREATWRHKFKGGKNLEAEIFFFSLNFTRDLAEFWPQILPGRSRSSTQGKKWKIKKYEKKKKTMQIHKASCYYVQAAY